MKNKFNIVVVLAIGFGLLYGVYSFRTNRLTQVTLDDIAKAQERVEMAEQQSTADSSETDSPNTVLAAEKDPAPSEAKNDTDVKLPPSPNDAATIIQQVPPRITVIPVESMPDAAPETFQVLFETSKGPFVVEFQRAWAPNGVARIYDLVRRKFFTDMRAFRAVENFVVQFGIPGDPKVSKEWLDNNIPDDVPTQSNTEGMVTFAAAPSPNTRSTQIFVNLKDNSRLDAMGFAPVGKVIFGLDVVRSLYSGYGDNVPQEPIATEGNAFLDQRFPELDTIKRGVFIEKIEDVASEVAKEREAFRQGMGLRQGAAEKAVSERAPDTFKVKFACTNGDFVVECHRDWAPLGVDRFYTLVKDGFFNDNKFFRVVPGFIVQFGLPSTPNSSGKWTRNNFADDPVKQSNVEGTVVFAMAGPNTRTTQMFVNLANNTQSLDPQGFSPVGKVIEGMDVVKTINPEYGERPDQAKIRRRGSEYLDTEFPRLDGIKTATLVE